MPNPQNDYGGGVDQKDLPWQSIGKVDLGNFNEDPEPENEGVAKLYKHGKVDQQGRDGSGYRPV